MNQRKRKYYKRYLEPDNESQFEVPSSSWYRFKKQRRVQQAVEYSGSFSRGNDTSPPEAEPSVNNDTVPAPHIDEHKPAEELSKTKVCDGSPVQISNPLLMDVVGSLAEEIDIENDKSNVYKEVTEDVPDFIMYDESDATEDYFIDAVDDENDPAIDEDGCEKDLLLQGYGSLEDAINAGAFMQPITTRVNKTVGEVVLIIIKYVLVHALSLTETAHLFRLINTIFSEPLISNSRYFIDKLFYPKNKMTLYATCSNCGASIGQFERKDHYVKCSICTTVLNVKDYGFKDFFAVMDVASPISKLIESNAEYYHSVVNRTVRNDGHIRDVYDGKKYRQFLETLNPTDRHSYATVTFNTDGAPLFESSSHSIWPIFLMVNEVPFHVRSKELILAGLWFGKDKPNMTVFLEPFVQSMNKLASEGVECTIYCNKSRIKIFTLICCVDAVARAPVQGFTQFNGSYGCGQCLHPGEWVRSDPGKPRSGNIKYPLQNYVPKDRSVTETIRHMNEAVKSNKTIFGVKSTSQLINLSRYDIIRGCVVDSLHCGSGIAKQFATLWFGNNKKAGLLPRGVIKNIDALMNTIKAPHQVGRLVRPFSEKEFWKAREWENWTLFYSMAVLRDVLPDDLLKHWVLFVEAFYILSQGELTSSEVDVADRLLRKFVGKCELVYGKAAMTFNVHSLLHLARSVSDWGPLWSHSAYAFESGNGDLLKVIHAAKGVHHQTCRRICLKYSYIDLKKHVYPSASSAVKQYCDTLGSTIAKQTFRLNRIRYFGSISRVNELWAEKLNLGEHSVSYKKIVKDSCLYMSALRANKRSDNSYAVLVDNTYVRIINFIVDSANQQEHAIVKKVETRNAYDNKFSMLQTIVAISDEHSAILTTSIAKICVNIKLTENEYLCAVPNLHYY